MVAHRKTETVPVNGSLSRASAVTSKGQATIPADIRRELKIEPGNKIMFRIENGRGVFEKVQDVDDAWNAGQSAMMGEWNDPALDIYND